MSFALEEEFLFLPVVFTKAQQTDGNARCPGPWTRSLRAPSKYRCGGKERVPPKIRWKEGKKEGTATPGISLNGTDTVLTVPGAGFLKSPLLTEKVDEMITDS